MVVFNEAMSSNTPKYKEAAILFGKISDYKDAEDISRRCWFNYAYFQFKRSRDYNSDPRETLELKLEAKEGFERAAGYATREEERSRYLATLELEIEAAKVSVADREKSDEFKRELEKRNFEAAEAMLAGKEINDEPERTILTAMLAKAKQEVELEALEAYFKTVLQSQYEIDHELSVDANLGRAFNSDHIFRNNSGFGSLREDRELVAKTLMDLHCYGLLAHWLELRRNGATAERDIYALTASLDTIVTALILMRQSGDQSPELAALIRQLGEVLADSSDQSFVNQAAEHVALLETHDPGPQWVPVLYPEWTEYTEPCTMANLIVNAPRDIKEALFHVPAQALSHARFGLSFSRQKADKLLAGFRPSKPDKTRYIYIWEQRDPPKNLRGIGVRSTFYESDAYQPASNPEMAGLAIYETYTYARHGSYYINNSERKAEVYLPTVNIEVVDLTSGKTLMRETISASPEAQYDVGDIQAGDAFCPYGFFDRGQFLKEKMAAVGY